MTRPIYETHQDRDRQERIVAVVARALGSDAHMSKPLEVYDCYLSQDGKVQAIMRDKIPRTG